MTTTVATSRQELTEAITHTKATLDRLRAEGARAGVIAVVEHRLNALLEQVTPR